ncbi:hypothetical protein IE81DRAFT_326763 [Ceraceosorus guamensis]|uniref:Uncharacterized protein n=1 Tax=Ceraceosorus guamensis TaxID=1522189 RepID=A0A316VNQ6_9BASI|nr:hypothetical protein IE81DRAFT_326763 [Ceraceosorus guamensis]PWN39207.1 hypothetical protein IE81DRAFT_326763 [Ceraceosorus guamensis]
MVAIGRQHTRDVMVAWGAARAAHQDDQEICAQLLLEQVANKSATLEEVRIQWHDDRAELLAKRARGKGYKRRIAELEAQVAQNAMLDEVRVQDGCDGDELLVEGEESEQHIEAQEAQAADASVQLQNEWQKELLAAQTKKKEFQQRIKALEAQVACPSENAPSQREADLQRQLREERTRCEELEEALDDLFLEKLDQEADELDEETYPAARCFFPELVANTPADKLVEKMYDLENSWSWHQSVPSSILQGSRVQQQHFIRWAGKPIAKWSNNFCAGIDHLIARQKVALGHSLTLEGARKSKGGRRAGQ